MSKKRTNGDFYLVLLLMLWFLCLYAGFSTGAFDNKRTWTASDMRGEYQRRMTRLDEREAKADSEWELLKIEAKRRELLAITVPYED